MTVDSLSLLMKSSWGTFLLGTANLVAPVLGYCLQLDGTTECPSNPSLAENLAWAAVTAYFWTSPLAIEHLRWRGVEV